MNKIIISMTSIERRAGTLRWTLDSLFAQTLKPTEVRLYAEPVVLNDHGLDPYPDLRRFSTEDRGSVTKISAIADPQLDDHDLIVTVDDDVVYDPRWLATLVDGVDANPGAAVGFSGWNVSSFLEDPVNGSYFWPRDTGPRDVLEGWAGVAYRKSFLDVRAVLSPPPLFRYVDDVWISWQLQRQKTPRITIPKGDLVFKGTPVNLPGLHNRPDFVSHNRTASVVSFGSQRKD